MKDRPTSTTIQSASMAKKLFKSVSKAIIQPEPSKHEMTDSAYSISLLLIKYFLQIQSDTLTNRCPLSEYSISVLINNTEDVINNTSKWYKIKQN